MSETDPLRKSIRGEPEPTACISDIKARDEKLVNRKVIDIYKDWNHENLIPINEIIKIYPRLTKIKREYLSDLRGSKPNNIGVKGKITTFSKRSRLNQIKFLCMINVNLKFWQDLTFPDDVMMNKSIGERAKYSTRVLHNLRKFIDRKWKGELFITWKREWQPRKSGCLEGQYCPHFHLLMGMGDFILEYPEWTEIAHFIAHKWIDLSGTEEREKALSVALDSRSYRPIKDTKQATKYLSKYMSKESEFETNGESIGRNWGVIGKAPEVKPYEMEATRDEMILLRRLMRKYIHKKHNMQKRLKRQGAPTFVIIDELTVMRMLEWVLMTNEEKALNF